MTRARKRCPQAHMARAVFQTSRRFSAFTRGTVEPTGDLRVGLDREPVVRIAHVVGAKDESWCVNGWRIHWTFHPQPARNAGSPKSRRRENVARDANRLRAASGDPTAGCISGIVAIGFALLRWFHRSARQPVTD